MPFIITLPNNDKVICAEITLSTGELNGREYTIGTLNANQEFTAFAIFQFNDAAGIATPPLLTSPPYESKSYTYLTGESNNIGLYQLPNNSGQTYVTPGPISTVSPLSYLGFSNNIHSYTEPRIDICFFGHIRYNDTDYVVSMGTGINEGGSTFSIPLGSQGVSIPTNLINILALPTYTENNTFKPGKVKLLQNTWDFRGKDYYIGFYVPSTSFISTIELHNVLKVKFYTSAEPGPIPSDNPYAPGGTSGTGGGNGDFDTSSDPVDFPDLPTLSAARCGLITMFNPTISELQQLSTKMWSKDFLDNLTRLISDPIDIIVALTIVPVTPPVSGREEVIAGLLSTGIEMNVISNQYMSFSCGTYKVTNFYDAALDYSPYTKASIYLPYIGVRQLNVDEIMGAELAIQYNIDLFTGACVAMIKVNNAVMYSFDGNVATQIPVSAANYSSLYSSLIQGVASIATTAVTGGAAAPMLAAQAASFAVNAVTSSKPNIQRAGGITGANGLMGIQTPFLIFEIPRQSLPENQQVYTGYPSNITYKLSDLSGFTQISEIHLDGIPATAQELEEIERILKEGVII